MQVFHTIVTGFEAEPTIMTQDGHVIDNYLGIGDSNALVNASSSGKPGGKGTSGGVGPDGRPLSSGGR